MEKNKNNAIKEINNRHEYVINNIECQLNIRVLNKNCITLGFAIYSLGFNKKFDKYTYHISGEKIKELNNYVRSNINNSINIKLKNSNKTGKYFIKFHDLTFKIQFLEVDDVLNYNQKLSEHLLYLENNLNQYKKIDYKNYPLVRADCEISDRTSYFYHLNKKYQLWEYKEWEYYDEKYFNYVINNFQNKKFILLRSLIGDCLYDIHTLCEVETFCKENKTILYKVCEDSKHIHIHNDLNINPLKDYNNFIRKIKIENILN